MAFLSCRTTTCSEMVGKPSNVSFSVFGVFVLSAWTSNDSHGFQAWTSNDSHGFQNTVASCLRIHNGFGEAAITVPKTLHRPIQIFRGEQRNQYCRVVFFLRNTDVGVEWLGERRRGVRREWWCWCERLRTLAMPLGWHPLWSRRMPGPLLRSAPNRWRRSVGLRHVTDDERAVISAT